MPLPAAAGLLGRVGTGLSGLTGVGGAASGFLTGTKTPLKFLAKNPMLGLPLGIMAGQFAYDAIGKPIYEGVKEGWVDDPLKNLRAQADMQLNAQIAREHADKNWDRVNRKMASASARLAAVAPHLYNQILAGRTLPQGAVVLGGSPRTDLLEQLAYGMATGKLNEQPSTEEEFLSTLGV